MSECRNTQDGVDAKKLLALIMTGDAIIRKPTPDRIAHWNEVKAIIQRQAVQPDAAPATEGEIEKALREQSHSNP
jgi:hypothetical protein